MPLAAWCVSCFLRTMCVSTCVLYVLYVIPPSVCVLSAWLQDVVRTIEKTPHLTRLALRGCLGPGADAKAERIAQLTGLLLSLDVSFNSSLTDKGLQALLAANASLTQLNMSWYVASASPGSRVMCF